MEQGRKNYFYADIIRVLAVFMVVLIHSAATLLNEWGEIPFDYWMWGNAYDSLSRASVPLFIMLSGALILGKQEDTRLFFKKRFSRLLFPFIFWVTVYINWRIFYMGHVLPVDKMIIEIFTGPVYYHLWYLYMVMGLYIITPVLRKLLQVIEGRELLYLFILWFIWNAALPLIGYLIYLYVGYSVHLGIKIPMIMGYTGYYILGYILSQKTFTKNAVSRWGAIFAGSSLLTFLGTWAFTDAAKGFQAILYDYFSPTVILQAVALFIILMYSGGVLETRIPAGGKKALGLLGKYSLGMYLVHVLLLTALGDGGLGFKLHGSSFHPAFAIPVTAIVAFALSFVIVDLLARIPGIRYAVVEKRAPSRHQ